MANDDFLVILKGLEESKANSETEHKWIIENIDSMIKNALKIIKLNNQRECAYPPTATQIATLNPGKKVKIDEILVVLRKANGTIHIDEICEAIGDKRGSKVSRIQISMVISWYIKKFKTNAEIKKLKKFSYCIKK